GSVGLVRLLDVVPDPHPVGFFFGEGAEPGLVLLRFDEHHDLIADADLRFAVDHGELGKTDDPFGLEADVDDRVILLDGDDMPMNYFAFAHLLTLEALLKHVAEGHLFSVLSVGGHQILFLGARVIPPSLSWGCRSTLNPVRVNFCARTSCSPFRGPL